MYARFPYVLHRILQKLWKENAIQKFPIHVQFLMMMQEVWKLGVFSNIYEWKRGLWIGALWEPRPCVTTDNKRKRYSKLIYGRSMSWGQRIYSLTKVCHSCFTGIPRYPMVCLAGRIAGLKAAVEEMRWAVHNSSHYKDVYGFEECLYIVSLSYEENKWQHPHEGQKHVFLWHLHNTFWFLFFLVWNAIFSCN